MDNARLKSEWRLRYSSVAKGLTEIGSHWGGCVKKFASTLLLICAVLIGEHRVLAQTPQGLQNQMGIRVDVLEEGAFETRGDVASIDAPQTPAGKTGEYSEIRLLRSGSEFKAVKGLTFGFRYKLTGPFKGPMMGYEMHVIHPPMVGQDGKTLTTTTAPLELYFANGVARDDIVYLLSEDFEVLPGRWTLQILLDGKPLISRDYLLH